MKVSSINTLCVIALFAIISFWSCTKEKVSTPAAQQSSSLTQDDALQPGESIAPQVVPGIYTITKFIDTSVDETAQFNGYTFDFQADHDLVVTTNTSAKFTGRWRTNAADT